MLIHELTHEQCVEVITRMSIGRLACSRADQPYVVPIHYSYDQERHCLYGFSSLGQKVLWMRDNPKVCVEVEDLASRERWTTVLMFGRYEEVGDTLEEAPTRQRIWDLFQQRSEWWLPAAARVVQRDRHAMVVFRISIDRATGRRAQRQRADS